MVCTILDIIFNKMSENGNPQYNVLINAGNGSFYATTYPDSQIGYEITNYKNKGWKVDADIIFENNINYIKNIKKLKRE